MGNICCQFANGAQFLGLNKLLFKAFLEWSKNQGNN